MLVKLIVGRNQSIAVSILKRLCERGELSRVQIGIGTPTGMGVMPCGKAVPSTQPFDLDDMDVVFFVWVGIYFHGCLSRTESC
jgi:hypothetical protein